MRAKTINTTILESLANSRMIEPASITSTDIIMNLLLVRAPFLSIIPAMKGWKTADTMLAPARRKPTSVFVKPLASRNAAAQACIEQKATK